MNVTLKMSQVDSKKDNGGKNHHHRISQYAIVAHLSAFVTFSMYLSRLFIWWNEQGVPYQTLSLMRVKGTN